MKNIKIDEYPQNLRKSVKYYESRQMTRSQPGIEQRFFFGQQVESYPRPAPMTPDLRKPMVFDEMYENPGKLEIEQRFLEGQQVESYPRPAPMTPDTRKTIKIYENL